MFGVVGWRGNEEFTVFFPKYRDVAVILVIIPDSLKQHRIITPKSFALFPLFLILSQVVVAIREIKSLS